MHTAEALQPVSFSEDDLVVHTLRDAKDLDAAYRLRHHVFAEDLGWVARSKDGIEMDAYDGFATAVGLFDSQNQLRGIFRMVTRPDPFMLESEFRACLHDSVSIRQERDTAEITRLALDPAITDRGLSTRMMKVLFKAVYQWCMQNDVRFLYMVVEKRFLRVLRAMGFPCEAISAGVSLPPAGAMSIAAVLDWNEFKERCPATQPAFFHWMNTVDGPRACETGHYVGTELKAEPTLVG